MHFYPEVYYPSGECLGWHTNIPFTDVLDAVSPMETCPLVIQKNRIQLRLSFVIPSISLSLIRTFLRCYHTFPLSHFSLRRYTTAKCQIKVV